MAQPRTMDALTLGRQSHPGTKPKDAVIERNEKVANIKANAPPGIQRKETPKQEASRCVCFHLTLRNCRH